MKYFAVKDTLRAYVKHFRNELLARFASRCVTYHFCETLKSTQKDRTVILNIAFKGGLTWIFELLWIFESDGSDCGGFDVSIWSSLPSPF